MTSRVVSLVTRKAAMPPAVADDRVGFPALEALDDAGDDDSLALEYLHSRSPCVLVDGLLRIDGYWRVGLDRI